MLRIVNVYPDVLGTYGDRGNGLVLRRRAQLRGLDVELSEVPSDEDLPAADLYCVGGGEDGPQLHAVDRLRADGTLVGAVGDGAVVLAVCAGLQVLGRSFPGPDGARVAGLGLLSVDTVAGSGPRAVGEALVVAAEPLGLLTGFENHAGRTVRDASVRPLGDVATGIGNGDGSDGVLEGRVVATYLHGPVLARNHLLADWLLELATGEDLSALDEDPSAVLHDERVAASESRERR